MNLEAEKPELLSLLQALQAGGLSKRQRPVSTEPTCVNPFTPEGLRVRVPATDSGGERADPSHI